MIQDLKFQLQKNKGFVTEGIVVPRKRVLILEECLEMSLALLDVIPGMARNPDPSEGCRLISKRVIKTKLNIENRMADIK